MVDKSRDVFTNRVLGEKHISGIMRENSWCGFYWCF